MRASHNTLIVLCISFLFVGAADQYYLLKFGSPNITFLPHSFVIAICLFVWCKQHGKENNKNNLGFYPLACAVFGLIGVPVYAFKFYGFTKGGWLLFKAVTACVAVVGTSYFLSLLVSVIYV
jgi:hypothetical protein